MRDWLIRLLGGISAEDHEHLRAAYVRLELRQTMNENLEGWWHD